MCVFWCYSVLQAFRSMRESFIKTRAAWMKLLTALPQGRFTLAWHGDKAEHRVERHMGLPMEVSKPNPQTHMTLWDVLWFSAGFVSGLTLAIEWWPNAVPNKDSLKIRLCSVRIHLLKECYSLEISAITSRTAATSNSWTNCSFESDLQWISWFIKL